MEKITPIKEELKQLGSGLGNFAVVNPYKVPAGFFDEFPARMFNLVSGGSLPKALASLSTPYEVPGGYFQNLAETILKKAKEESIEEKPVAQESVKDELAGLSSILSGIDKKTPFTVPDNYFTELSGNVISGAQAVDMVNEELENLSPLMAGLKPINVYSVPDEYFKELPGIVLNKVKISQSAGTRVVKGNFRYRTFQYAAAAIITGLMITAGFFFANRNTRQQELVSINGLKEKAAETSDEEILNYLSTHQAPIVDSLINNVPEIKADAILDMLANVSDEELQQYLQLQSDSKILIN